jgi:DNA-binding MarR family transcriptional regulator
MYEKKSIGRLISILYRHAKVYFHRKLDGYGLGHGQVPVLMHIIQHEPVTQHQINQHFHLDKGSTSALIKSLEKNGLIYREQDSHDKRAYFLYTTEETQNLMPELKQVFKGWTDILIKDFNENEKEQAFSLLNRMIINSEAYLDIGKGEDES